MNKIKDFFTKEKLIKIINILFVLSIILDLHIFYNSISTLIRIIFITILFGIIFLLYSNKKEKKLLFFYFILLLIYIILHILSINNFYVPHYSSYSILKELLYFIKMIMNVLIIYIIYKLNYNLKNFKNTLIWSTILIAASIIICNIFEIGYTSYDFESLKYNIFDWTNEKYSFVELSSKGYFHLTNQISAILALYYGLLLIYLNEKIECKTIGALLLAGTSMIMLGTRVSNYIPMILLVIATFIYLLLTIVKREKINYKFIFILLILFSINCALYQIAPLQLRNAYYDNLFNEKEKTNFKKDESIPIDLSSLTNKNFKKLLENYNIVPEFYNDYYKLEYDREFYEYYISLATSKINDTRFLEEQVIKRVKELNNNKADDYFGIGYDRIMNIFNIESDYTMQYYAIGIIGVILILGVNIGILLWAYFKILFNLYRYLNYKNCMLLISGTFVLVISYFSGNILNAISCIIPISFVMGIIINELSIKEKCDYESYLGFKTTTKNKKEILNNIFEEKEQVILFNINPLIVMNNRKNKTNLETINNEKYNIPDGNGIVLASKLKSGNINEVVPGIEMLESICKESIKNDYTIYLYGSKETSVKNTKDSLEKKYKNIKIVGYSNGYIDEKKVIKAIKKCKPDILFVGLGSPKQENFIINNKKELKNVKIIMPVGGSFDVLGGNINRAPKIWQKLKLEWLYRMIKEPKRFKQLGLIITFMFLVILGNICYNNEEV